MSSKGKILSEIAVIRPILIILLVVYHSFIIYQGGWSEPIGFEHNRAYWWISKASYSFMLEAFVMISGYVYAYQASLNPPSVQNGGGKQLIFSKLKRLILPSVIFSIIYFALFAEYESLASCVYIILNGAGHMWYLPMLFWCFIGCYLIEKVALSNKCKLIGLIAVASVSFLPLPLRLNSAMYYLLFFYVGYLVYSLRDWLSDWITAKKILASWAIYVFVFVAFTLAIEYIQLNLISASDSIYFKAVYFTVNTLLKLVYATMGCFAVYATALYITNKKEPTPNIIKFGSISMGVYIIQQFVLMWLYYHTKLPEVAGSIWLPWVGLAITLIVSIIGAKILKSLPLTKHLI